MGFFSWRCAKTKLPILTDLVDWPKEVRHLSEAVALFANGDRIRGSYDGYGRVGSFDNLADHSGFKIVVARHYAGESYDQLPASESDLNQGYFWNDRDLVDLVSGRLPADFTSYLYPRPPAYFPPGQEQADKAEMRRYRSEMAAIAQDNLDPVEYLAFFNLAGAELVNITDPDRAERIVNLLTTVIDARDAGVTHPRPSDHDWLSDPIYRLRSLRHFIDIAA